MMKNKDYKKEQKKIKKLSKRVIAIEKSFKGYNRAERRTKAYKQAVIEGIKTKSYTKPGR
jgi:hypothetical protein